MTDSDPQWNLDTLVAQLDEIIRYVDQVQDFVLGAILSDARERLDRHRDGPGGCLP